MVSTRHLRIFHAEHGDPEAPVVLLVHGFPTSSIDWYDVVDRLRGQHRVCMVDFPGFGFSDKPTGERYTLTRDAELLDHYLHEIVGVDAGTVVAHDRGDSVALALLARGAAGASPFQITNLVLSNANIFLPLSNLTDFQRRVLDPASWPAVRDVLTPELLAAGLGDVAFTPTRGLNDPAVAALADTFGVYDGVRVLHDTIQYLVQRAEHETEWLDVLARSSVPTTLVWGLYDTISPLRVANHVWLNYLVHKPGDNTFWVLPRANHYLQHDQPDAFAAVVAAVNSPTAADLEPGPLSDEPGAALFVDRSRPRCGPPPTCWPVPEPAPTEGQRGSARVERDPQAPGAVPAEGIQVLLGLVAALRRQPELGDLVEHGSQGARRHQAGHRHSRTPVRPRPKATWAGRGVRSSSNRLPWPNCCSARLTEARLTITRRPGSMHWPASSTGWVQVRLAHRLGESTRSDSSMATGTNDRWHASRW